MNTGSVTLSDAVFDEACRTLRVAIRGLADRRPVIPFSYVTAEGSLWGDAEPDATRLLRFRDHDGAVGAGVALVDDLTRAGLTTGTLPWRLALASLVGVPMARRVCDVGDVDAFIVDAAVLGIDAAIEQRR